MQGLKFVEELIGAVDKQTSAPAELSPQTLFRYQRLYQPKFYTLHLDRVCKPNPKLNTM